MLSDIEIAHQNTMAPVMQVAETAGLSGSDLEQYGLYINGKWVPASDGATFTARCPATGTPRCTTHLQ